MVKVAVWRHPQSKRWSAQVFGLPGALDGFIFKSIKNEGLLVEVIEREIRKRLPQFISVEIRFLDVGWRSHPTTEELRLEVEEWQVA